MAGGRNWGSKNIEETENFLNMKKEEGKGKVKLKRQLRASMMGKCRKYRNMWKIEVDRLMRETVEATGVEKSAEKKAALTLCLEREKRYRAPRLHTMDN